MKLTGAQILIECLKKEGVEIAFGIPGGANLPTFDALRDSGIKVVMTRHEQGAAHMADGYARATGKVGVCFATSGPGATNPKVVRVPHDIVKDITVTVVNTLGLTC